MKKKYLIIITVLLLIILGIAISVFVFNKDNNTNNNVNSYGKLNNIEGKYSDIVITDIKTAKESLEDIKDDLNIDSVKNELREDISDTSGDVINTYKFKQVYNGIDVYQGGVIVYTDKNGNANGVINSLKNISNIDTNPKSSITDIENVVKKEYGDNTKIHSSRQIIYQLKEDEFILAYEYKINLSDSLSEDTAETIIISDKTKEIVSKNVPIYYLEKNDMNYFLKNDTYTLIDEKRGIGIYAPSSNTLSKNTNIEIYSWKKSNEQLTNENKLATDAMSTIQKCYDYYKDKFNYFSFTGNGLDTNSSEKYDINVVTSIKSISIGNIDVEGFNNNAAYMHPGYIILGYNNTYNNNVEVLGHEYTHGVFAYIVGNDEEDLEKKALNEAYADIMGMCIEAYYNNSNTIDGYINSSEERNIKDSNLKYSYNELNRNSVTEWAKTSFLGKEEHYYSVIISKAAYLMSQHMTLEEFEKLWFNSMKLLPEDCNFNDCYYAVVKTARSMKFSDEKLAEIKKAFTSVGLQDYEQITDSIKEYADKTWDNNKSNPEIIGTWKAVVTNSNIHSLGELYGTAFPYANELIFKEDGTYKLAIGVTYWQEGNYEIEGDMIKLTNTQYKGDNPDKKIAERFIINNEKDKKQIIMEEEPGDNTIVNVIFVNAEDTSDVDNIINSYNNTNTNSSTKTNNSTNTNSSTKTNNSTNSSTTGKIKIGNYSLEYGKYKSNLDPSANVSGTFVLNSDNTCSYKGIALTGGENDWDVTGTFKITKEDLYGYGTMSDCIEFTFSNGKTYSFEVYKNNEFSSDWIGFAYSGN